MYTQTDTRWKNKYMTNEYDFVGANVIEIQARYQMEKDGIRGDTIGRWGCLVTCLANAYNQYHEIQSMQPDVAKNLTPGLFNEQLRLNRGYQALTRKYCQIGQESYIVWPIAQMLLGIKNVDYHFSGKIEINHDKYWYIARVPFRPPTIMGGHYCNVVGAKNGIKYFDVDSGKIRTDWENNNNYFVHRIEFV